MVLARSILDNIDLKLYEYETFHDLRALIKTLKDKFIILSYDLIYVNINSPTSILPIRSFLP